MENGYEQNLAISDSDPDVIDIKIAAHLIERPSITDQEIAERLGISRQTVNRRRNSKGVRDTLRSILAIPEREVRRISAKALIQVIGFVTTTVLIQTYQTKTQLRLIIARRLILSRSISGLLMPDFRQSQNDVIARVCDLHRKSKTNGRFEVPDPKVF